MKYAVELFVLCASVGLLAFVIATDLKRNPVLLYAALANFVFQLVLLFYWLRLGGLKGRRK